MNTPEKTISRRAFRVFRSGLASIAIMAQLAAVTTATGVAAVAFATVQAAPAKAAGMNRFVRIGLNKSIVVRLPREASDVLIGNPKVADATVRSRKVAYIFARKIGQTNIFFLDSAGRQILALDVEVSKDTKALQKLIRRTLPNSRIIVDMMGERVVLRGTAKTASEAKQAMQMAIQFASGKEENVVNAMSIAGKDQVMIKVKIAEVQRSVAKQLGIDWNAALQAGKVATSVLMSNPFSLGSGLLSSSNMALSYTGSKFQLSSALRALERDGLMRLLAEPTLTAVSGEPAKFLAGGEVPVPVAYDTDTNTITYELKPFGVALGFTPVVLSEGRISLKINTEVSEISSKYSVPIGGSTTMPGFEKRSTETTVELPSGGTLAIGGLIREQTKQNIDGIPGAKNLPILGALFRSRDFQSDQSELVIMVTPYIVNPVNERKLRTPQDRLNIATDPQTIFLGRLHKVYGAPSGPKGSGMVYHGNVGFIIE